MMNDMMNDMRYVAGNTVYYIWKPNYSTGGAKPLYYVTSSDDDDDTYTIISFRIMI